MFLFSSLSTEAQIVCRILRAFSQACHLAVDPYNMWHHNCEMTLTLYCSPSYLFLSEIAVCFSPSVCIEEGGGFVVDILK